MSECVCGTVMDDNDACCVVLCCVVKYSVVWCGEGAAQCVGLHNV